MSLGRAEDGEIMVDFHLDLTNDKRKVLELFLGTGKLTFSGALVKTGWKERRVRQVLRSLEIDGVLASVPGGLTEEPT